MDLMDLLQGQMSEGLVDVLAQQIGGADKAQTKTAADGILSTIMSGLAKNATSSEGVSGLASALDRDHDGSILDDVMGMVAGQKQVSNPKMLDGAGILKHILGGKQSGAIDMISQMSGLDSGKTGNLMSILAPLVMGALGRQKRTQNLDNSGLSDYLQRSVKSAGAQRQEMGLIGKLLDQDGDGSVMDDIAGLGMNMLGKFLKK